MKLVAGFVIIYCIVLTQVRVLPPLMILVMTFAFGPACFSIYGAALSLAGKRVLRDQLAIASASLVTGWCLGGFAGSILVGMGMDLLNAWIFPVALLVFAAAIAAVVTGLVPANVQQLENSVSLGLGRTAGEKF
jgi:hypothetical protein